MIFRPTGLISFKDFDPVRLVQPRDRGSKAQADATAAGKAVPKIS
jgi:hypothetical protein